MNFARISRTVWWLGLIFCVGLTAARAQVPNGTVIPTVCFESKPETLTRTLANSLNEGDGSLQSPQMTEAVPFGFYKVVFNPDGATRESFPISYRLSSGFSIKLAAGANTSVPPFRFAHEMGETVLLTSDGKAAFGYNNTSSTAVTIGRGIPNNYFFDGLLVYATQPNTFQPGIHENIVLVNVVSGYTLTWFLNGGQAISTAEAKQGCATITYQGRLSDAGNSANGQFDLQFQAFDSETGGVVQSELITLDNVQVTSGVFTVPLFFGSSLSNNFKPRFLEIGVRAGTSTGAFTVLTPRQPITSVPYAVNAQTAATATNVSGGFVQLPLTTNAPPASECNAASQYGRQKVDATNNRLWICTATGWKSTILQ